MCYSRRSYLSGSEKRSYNPRSFCNTFPDLGNTDNQVDVSTDVYVQHDATEFVLSLFNKLKDTVVGTIYADTILSMFNITLYSEKSATINEEFKLLQSNETTEPILQLNIEGHNDIRRALDEEFRGSEVEFKWEGEKENVMTTKRPTIKTLPDTLIIALKRFGMDYTQEPMVAVKNNDRVAFPLLLNMNPYTAKGREKLKQELTHQKKQEGLDNASSSSSTPTKDSSNDTNATTPHSESKTSTSKNKEQETNNDPEDPEEEEEESKSSSSSATDSLFINEDADGLYELCGITIHSGNAGSGHYWSYSKDRSTNKWCEFNDDR